MVERVNKHDISFLFSFFFYFLIRVVSESGCISNYRFGKKKFYSLKSKQPWIYRCWSTETRTDLKSKLTFLFLLSFTNHVTYINHWTHSRSLLRKNYIFQFVSLTRGWPHDWSFDQNLNYLLNFREILTSNDCIQEYIPSYCIARGMMKYASLRLLLVIRE